MSIRYSGEPEGIGQVTIASNSTPNPDGTTRIRRSVPIGEAPNHGFARQTGITWDLRQTLLTKQFDLPQFSLMRPFATGAGRGTAETLYGSSSPWPSDVTVFDSIDQ